MGTPCLLQNMTMKRDQTVTVNIAKRARKNKYGHWQIFEKPRNLTKTKMSVDNYFENLETTHSLSMKI